MPVRTGKKIKFAITGFNSSHYGYVNLNGAEVYRKTTSGFGYYEWTIPNTIDKYFDIRMNVDATYGISAINIFTN